MSDIENGTKCSQKDDGPILSFDIHVMSEEELRHQLELLQQRQPNIITPYDAASTLRTLRKSGITGGRDHLFLQCNKDALHTIMGSEEPLNFNIVLSDVIQQRWNSIHRRGESPQLRIVNPNPTIHGRHSD